MRSAALFWFDHLMRAAFPPQNDPATFWLTHRLRSSPRFWGL